MDYDVVVVGGGLAGLTASLYTARHGLRTVLVEQMMPGGQVLNTERIETFPGFPDGISGFELGPTVQTQVENAGAEVEMATVAGLTRDGDRFTVRGEGGEEFRGRAVVIANGSSRRLLGVPGESEFLGRGVGQCASCDGHFFAGKRVVVVGGGDSALEESAVLLEQGVAQILLVHRGKSFRAQKSIVDKIGSLGAIKPLFETELTEVRGEGTVNEVVLRQGDTTRTEAVDGVFPFVGLDPNSAWARDVVDVDPGGHVVTDIWLRTSVPGVFAAGDIRQNSAAQLASAAGDGATAAVAVVRYLDEQ
ncbi:FAD-binding protein [Amycolatopsis acidicola]|uniref:FAD-binding protein n=1 Tax=Amycolatopsis acidicola TaxID=2596893 RepID=A0A5N0V1B1_9PSEU|nr:FAD-dependent oxidoreductase [Amycolatopsis acidicola]KAA9157797.1 FAD-binding protein [Amycolatopsis acidicola]